MNDDEIDKMENKSEDNTEDNDLIEDDEMKEVEIKEPEPKPEPEPVKEPEPDYPPIFIDDEAFDLGLDNMDYNSKDFDSIDFQHLETDLERFQQEEIAQEALYKVDDLQTYSVKINKDLDDICEEAVNDYLSEVNNFAALNEDINKCDNILEKMQGILGVFQKNLQGISKEIKVLQVYIYN